MNTREAQQPPAGEVRTRLCEFDFHAHCKGSRADGLRELDERMAKLEKTLERMEDWAEQVGKHLGRRLEPG